MFPSSRTSASLNSDKNLDISPCEVTNDLLSIIEGIRDGNVAVSHNMVNENCVEFKIKLSASSPVVTLKYQMRANNGLVQNNPQSSSEESAANNGESSEKENCQNEHKNKNVNEESVPDANSKENTAEACKEEEKESSSCDIPDAKLSPNDKNDSEAKACSSSEREMNEAPESNYVDVQKKEYGNKRMKIDQ